jgi:hypothetical protein
MVIFSINDVVKGAIRVAAPVDKVNVNLLGGID